MGLRDVLLASGQDLAARNDQSIAAAISAGRTKVVGVSRAVFAKWAAAGPRATVEDTAATQGDPLRASALSLKDFMAGAGEVLEVGDPAIAYLLGQWVAAGKITQAELDSLVALATVPDPYTVGEVSDELNRMHMEGLI